MKREVHRENSKIARITGLHHFRVHHSMDCLRDLRGDLALCAGLVIDKRPFGVTRLIQLTTKSLFGRYVLALCRWVGVSATVKVVFF